MAQDDFIGYCRRETSEIVPAEWMVPSKFRLAWLKNSLIFLTYKANSSE